MVFYKIEICIESLGFVYIFQSQVLQDSIIIVVIIINVMENIQLIDVLIFFFYVWLDNVGCYKLIEMMVFFKLYGLVRFFNFCEVQNGKGLCDRIGVILKLVI